MGVHTATASDSDDHTIAYGGNRTDKNKLDTLLAMSVQQIRSAAEQSTMQS